MSASIVLHELYSHTRGGEVQACYACRSPAKSVYQWVYKSHISVLAFSNLKADTTASCAITPAESMEVAAWDYDIL